MKEKEIMIDQANDNVLAKDKMYNKYLYVVNDVCKNNGDIITKDEALRIYKKFIDDYFSVEGKIKGEVVRYIYLHFMSYIYRKTSIDTKRNAVSIMISKAQDGDVDARDRLVKHYSYLVLEKAKEYDYLEYEELVQYGMIKLIEMIDHVLAKPNACLLLAAQCTRAIEIYFSKTLRKKVLKTENEHNKYKLITDPFDHSLDNKMFELEVEETLTCNRVTELCKDRFMMFYFDTMKLDTIGEEYDGITRQAVHDSKGRCLELLKKKFYK